MQLVWRYLIHGFLFVGHIPSMRFGPWCGFFLLDWLLGIGYSFRIGCGLTVVFMGSVPVSHLLHVDSDSCYLSFPAPKCHATLLTRHCSVLWLRAIRARTIRLPHFRLLYWLPSVWLIHEAESSMWTHLFSVLAWWTMLWVSSLPAIAPEVSYADHASQYTIFQSRRGYQTADLSVCTTSV